jgi:ribosomal protein L7/L12
VNVAKPTIQIIESAKTVNVDAPSGWRVIVTHLLPDIEAVKSKYELDGDKIFAIKELRKLTGYGLYEAKQVVDKWKK